MKFLNNLITATDLDQLQKRISEVFALLISVLIVLLSGIDLVLGFKVLFVLIKLSFAVPFFVGFLIMKRIGQHQAVLNGFFAFGLIAISLNFFLMEENRDRTLYTIFVFVVSNVILMNGRSRFVWLGIIFLVYGLLFWVRIDEEYSDSSQFSSLSMFQNHLVTMVWTSLFLFVLIYLFIRSYQIQNRSMAKLQKDNELVLEELKVMNVRKNQLLALLSHDLKNPVTSLNFTLELAEQGMINEKELFQIITNLKNQSFHLGKVLDNTLAWVLSEMEGAESELSLTEPISLAEEMVDMMSFQANQKSQQLVLETLGTSLRLNLAIKEIKIILKNFLDNAIKFSPEGSTIYLIISQKTDFLRWEVRNQGVPIGESERQFLFEFKARKSEGTKKEKGTGIGLSLCKKIATSKGWDLGYQFTPEEWNVFYLEMPMSKGLT